MSCTLRLVLDYPGDSEPTNIALTEYPDHRSVAPDRAIVAAADIFGV